MDVETLFDRHYPALLRYLTLYTGDSHEAADAAQETYLRLLKRPPERQDNVRAWLFTVATNVVRDRWRKRHVALQSDVIPQALVGDPPPDPQATVEREERCRNVRRLLMKLTPKQRIVLLMREEGFAQREIAQAVGTTTKSVGTMIARALDRLATELEQAGEELS
ncbi:MAG: RNA polymerase sigma factor [Gemmatimonadales bacterium]